MFVKIKAFINRNRMAFTASAMCAMFACMTMAGASAGGTPTFDLSTIMTNSVQSIVTNLLNMIGAVLPITVTLLGAAIGITYGINFIRKLLGKAHG